MKQVVFSLLIILSVAALLQPLIYFYIYHGAFSFLGFTMAGCLSTFFLFILNLHKKMPKAFVWWSAIIFCVGVSTAFMPERWLYTADGLFLMAQREKIVKDIKAKSITKSRYYPQRLLPVSIHNWITIEANQGVYREIRFPTRDVSFLDTWVEGVLYSELPEHTIAYYRTSEVGGVITEYSLKIRKIKARWYFYTYESAIIHD